MKWANIPVPEGHLIPLILGLILQILFPEHLWTINWVSFSLGIPLFLAGILLVGWSVYTVREIEIESPSRLITTGPYAFSRNPMYVAWSLIYLAAVFLANSLWLLVLFLPVLIYTHLFAILPEEKKLAHKFNEAYLAYKSRVRRYL